MEARPFWHLSSTLTWIFVFSFPSTCSGMDAPKLHLDSSVFVAFADSGLRIQCELAIPANYSQDNLRCFDPSNSEIYTWAIHSTGHHPILYRHMLELKPLMSSGEYYCQYKTVKAYFFLRVRHHGYKDVGELDYMFITVGFLTGALLIFSVVGSVYVFRGHWKESTSDPGNSSRNRKKTRQERKEREAMEDDTKEDNTKEDGMKEDDINVTASTSFYASLEARPRSIYDVLDHSAVTTEPDQSKAKPKKKKTQKTVNVNFVIFSGISVKHYNMQSVTCPLLPPQTVQTSQPQQEGVFESIYENF